MKMRSIYYFFLVAVLATPAFLSCASTGEQLTSPVAADRSVTLPQGAIGNDALTDAMQNILSSVQSLQRQQGRIWHQERLDFLKDRIEFSESSPQELRQLCDNHVGNGPFFLLLPSRHDLERRTGQYDRWRRTQLLMQATRAGQEVGVFEQSSRWRQHEDRMLRTAALRHSRQEAYDQHLDRMLGQGVLGTADEETVIGLVNQGVLERQQHEAHEWYVEDADSLGINYRQQINPSISGGAVNILNRVLFTPWRDFYRRHKSEIDAFSQLLIIVSASAFIFNKLGGTEWVKNKIRRMFDQPTVYEVIRRKKGWLDDAKPGEVVREDDLILSANVRKQVSEMIYLLRRRYELRKKTGKRYAMTPMLLYGPPGTGKTTIAKMIADQSIGDDGHPMNFIKLVASDFMQVKNEGDRVAVLKRMFSQARSMKNTVIFLDEVDGMVRQRGEGDERVNRAFLDHLLDEIAQPSADFMVIAATNHKNRVDKALLSRFRRKIEVLLPNLRQREAMILRYARRILLKQYYKVDFDHVEVADLMQGASGRDIETFFLRARDRLAFIDQNNATSDIANQILREMGFLPALPEEDEVALPMDTEELIGM